MTKTSTQASTEPPTAVSDATRAQRWRLVLGSEADAACGALAGPALQMDQALAALYEPQGLNGLAKRQGGRGGSAPNVARWLGDIRKYFPAQVVQVMQRDALARLDMRDMLLQPEMLETVQPDVHLVANLVALGSVIPAKTKDTARMVVRKVVDALMEKLNDPLRSAISGALDRSRRNRRPRHSEIDWHRTIRANLKHWQPDYRTIVPETLVGYGRKARRPQREVVLCIDQSGSMAQSVVYASIFAAVMASLPAVSTKLVVFDTAVVDLTEKLDDPVELLFGVQLGGGTDINRAVAYAQKEFVAPAYDRELAAKLAALGVPSFACTPDAFPGLMAAAIRKDDVSAWAAGQGLVTSRAAR